MTKTAQRRLKEISLCFRGFEMHPHAVQTLMGKEPSLVLERGKPVRPGMTTLAVRSAISFRVEMESGCRLAEMIPNLFAQLGGVDHLLSVRNAVRPEFFEVNFLLPVKQSKDQEGGALEKETIADLARLGASASFAFL